MEEKEAPKKKSVIYRAAIIFLVSFILFAFGIASSNFSAINMAINAESAVVLTIMAFILPLSFYGYLTPLLMLALGFFFGQSLLESGESLLLAFPVLVAVIAGLVLATNLKDDFDSKEEHKIQYWKKSFIILIIAIALALALWGMKNL